MAAHANLRAAMDAAADLTGLAALLLAALLAGWALSRAGEPVSPGYMLAGIVCGPSVFGFIANERSIRLAAEGGALVLLFIVGVELSVRALRAEKRTAIAVVIGQIAIALLAMLIVAALTDITLAGAVTIGFAVALASPAGMTEIFDRAGIRRARAARAAVAILIAGTLAFLPMSIVVDSVGAGGFGLWALVKTAFGICLIVVIAYLLGRRRRYHVPLAHLATEHAEISPIAALAYGLAGTIVFGVLGLTGAVGAFAAGLLLSGSRERGVFASSLAPLRAAAKLIFFAAFGALVDVGYVFSHLFTFALGLVAISVARFAATTWLMQFAGAPLPRAFASSAALWPSGETSFLLVVGAFSTYALGADEAKLALALIAATVLTSPVTLAMVRRVRASVDIADWRSLGAVVIGGSPQPKPAAANIADIGAQVREAAGLYGDPAPRQRPPDPHA